jgi:hypothetical protein
MTLADDQRDQPRKIECPRCGYDQRGVVARWTESCPLAGTCSECGLDWQWCDLLSPKLRGTDWFVEHAFRWWQIPYRTFTTLIMALRPWRFWREVRLTDRFRFGAMVAFLVLVLALLAIVLDATHGIAASLHYRQMRAAGAPPPVSHAEFVIRSVALPWSEGTGPAKRWWPLGRRYFWDRAYGSGGTWIRRSVLIAAMSALMPLTFMAIPITRRRAKVRWPHLIRICIYGMPIVGLAIGFAIVQNLSQHWSALRWLVMTNRMSNLVLFVIVPAMLGVWWWHGVSRYLRLPHAPAVTILFGAMAYLGAYVLFVVLEMRAI